MNTDTISQNHRVDRGVWVNRGLIAVCAVFIAIMAFRFYLASAFPPIVTAAVAAPAIQTTPILVPPPTITSSAVVTSVSAPVGMKALVPPVKSAYKVLSDGSVRVTLQFEPKDAAAAESLASQRGVPFWVSVTRGK